jgi:hypothetical protein
VTLTVVPEQPMARVIQLEPGKQSRVTYTGSGKCHHRGSFIVDEGARTVECEACGAALDAFQVLLDYANKERSWKHWQGEVRETQKRVDELKDEERKVKARTKSASRKEAGAAVAAERARTERERMDIAELARDVGGLARRIERLCRTLAKEQSP